MGAIIPSVVQFLLRRFFSKLLINKEEGRALRSSIIGMSLGLIPLITVMVVADGMINGIVDRFKETLTYHLQIQPFGIIDINEFETQTQEIRNLEGVKGAWIEKQGFGLAYSGQRRTGISIRGIDPSFLEDQGWQNYVVYIQGKNQDLGEREVQLGQEVAQKLWVSVGDEIKILTTRRTDGRQLLPRITTLRVSAILSSGYQELDRLWALIPLDQAQIALPTEDYLPFIGVKVKEGVNFTAVADSIRKIIPPTWRLRSWYEINRNQYQNYQSTRAILMIIMSMILMVSAVNIASSLIMTYLERRKEVAILKSIGMSPANIQLYFGLLGLMASAMGTILGVVLGLLVAININEIFHFIEQFLSMLSSVISGRPETIKLLDPAYYLQVIPINLSIENLMLISFLSLIFGTIASWLPASRASKTRPLSIIRKI